MVLVSIGRLGVIPHEISAVVYVTYGHNKARVNI